MRPSDSRVARGRAPKNMQRRFSLVAATLALLFFMNSVSARHAVDARLLTSRALLEFSDGGCNVTGKTPPVYLSNMTTSKTADKIWYCFTFAYGKCPKPGSPCCTAKANKLAFDLSPAASKCAVSGNSVVGIYYKDDDPASASPIDKTVTISSSPTLTFREFNVTKEDIESTEGRKLCFDAKFRSGTPMCPIFSGDNTTTYAVYRVYDLDYKPTKKDDKVKSETCNCCLQGNVTTPPNTTRDTPGTPPATPPSPPLPPVCRCATYNATNFPWRAGLTNVSADGSRVCLKLHALPDGSGYKCDDSAGCCRRGLKRVELYGLNPTCQGSRAPYTLTTVPTAPNQPLTGWSWSKPTSALKFAVNLPYSAGANGKSVDFCFTLSGACSNINTLCSGKACNVAVFDDQAPPPGVVSACCPSSSLSI